MRVQPVLLEAEAADLQVGEHVAQVDGDDRLLGVPSADVLDVVAEDGLRQAVAAATAVRGHHIAGVEVGGDEAAQGVRELETEEAVRLAVLTGA